MGLAFGVASMKQRCFRTVETISDFRMVAIRSHDTRYTKQELQVTFELGYLWMLVIFDVPLTSHELFCGYNVNGSTWVVDYSIFSVSLGLFNSLKMTGTRLQLFSEIIN